MRVVVTGGAGQLARAVRETWTGHELICLDRSALDLADPDAIRAALGRYRPNALLNLGAFTHVDRCETEAPLAMKVNGEAVGWLTDVCRNVGASLLQISTDYVFDGNAMSPYPEDALPTPISVYGRSKHLGEQMAHQEPNNLVVRTGWLYDAWGRNFLNTMLAQAATGEPITVVRDQVGGPTSCRALARQLQIALEEGWHGTVNITCGGATSWYGFAQEIFLVAGIQANLRPCVTAERKPAAPRPAYSVLSPKYRQSLGKDRMPDWREALREVLAAMPDPREGKDTQ